MITTSLQTTNQYVDKKVAFRDQPKGGHFEYIINGK
jgi:hypothetical protein